MKLLCANVLLFRTLTKITVNLKNLSAMKSKVFLLVCLFIGIGLTKLSAQPAIGKSGNMNYYDDPFSFAEKVPLNCDYNDIDYLVGMVRCHTILHYSKFDGNIDNWDWCKNEFHGELVLLSTGETFIVSDKCTTIGPSESLPTIGHFNAVGNQGSHYIVYYLWDDWADISDLTIVSVKCPGNN
jgi:hypothetical protein